MKKFVVDATIRARKTRQTKLEAGVEGVERKRTSEKEFISTLGIKVTVNDVE